MALLHYEMIIVWRGNANRIDNSAIDKGLSPDKPGIVLAFRESEHQRKRNHSRPEDSHVQDATRHSPRDAAQGDEFCSGTGSDSQRNRNEERIAERIAGNEDHRIRQTRPRRMETWWGFSTATSRCPPCCSTATWTPWIGRRDGLEGIPCSGRIENGCTAWER